jgi:hypothetical protein
MIVPTCPLEYTCLATDVEHDTYKITHYIQDVQVTLSGYLRRTRQLASQLGIDLGIRTSVCALRPESCFSDPETAEGYFSPCIDFHP